MQAIVIKFPNLFPFSEEFVAHAANVNCLALGHKSGRVLVTGGDDKKVNLWAVGKPNCIMVRNFGAAQHVGKWRTLVRVSNTIHIQTHICLTSECQKRERYPYGQ